MIRYFRVGLHCTLRLFSKAEHRMCSYTFHVDRLRNGPLRLHFCLCEREVVDWTFGIPEEMKEKP